MRFFANNDNDDNNDDDNNDDDDDNDFDHRSLIANNIPPLLN